MGKGSGNRTYATPGAKERYDAGYGKLDWGNADGDATRCPSCGRNVKDYVREYGTKWCPWCNIKIEEKGERDERVL